MVLFNYQYTRHSCLSTIDGFEDQDGFVATIDRLNLLTSYISPDSSLTSWVRLDSIVYNNPPSAERFETKVIPERLQLNYESKS